jgi:hypothetical protein
MIYAASHAAKQAEVPTLTEIAIQLAMVEKRRSQLITMLDYRASEVCQHIDEEQFQMLMDFILMQAAKKNMDSDELVMEVQFHCGLDNLRHLPMAKIWDAMLFVKAY